MTRTAARAAPRGGPSLATIRRWPATVSVEDGAAAVGISRSMAYELIAAGEPPFRVLKVRGRYKVITASLIALLGNDEAAGPLT